MLSRLIVVAVALGSALVAADCPVTRPSDPAFVPSEPSNPNVGIVGARVGGEFAYGTDALWTLLETSGVWRVLRQKVWYWRKGWNPRTEPVRDLAITGRRLDGDSPPFRTQGGASGMFRDGTSAMLRAVDIPATGCWEITGQYRGNSLSFVVLVQP